MKSLTLAFIADIIFALLYTLFVAGVRFNTSISAFTTYPWVGFQDIILAFVGSAIAFMVPLLIWVWLTSEKTKQERQPTEKEIRAGISELHGSADTPITTVEKEGVMKTKKKSPIITAIAYFIGGIVITVVIVAVVLLIVGPGGHIGTISNVGSLGSIALGIWGYYKTKGERQK